MNCAYHNHNVAVVNCNGCGKPCVRRAPPRKGFSLLPVFIVMAWMLRRKSTSNQILLRSICKTPNVPAYATIFIILSRARRDTRQIQTAVYFAVFVDFFNGGFDQRTPLFVSVF